MCGWSTCYVFVVPVMVAVDLGEGEPVAVGYVDEPDPLAVQPDGDKRLYALWKQVRVSRGRRSDPQTPGYQLRDLPIRLSENWSYFCTFYTDPAIPWTNNGTEQVIGRLKMRARTVRGYKTWAGMQTGLMMVDTKSD